MIWPLAVLDDDGAGLRQELACGRGRQRDEEIGVVFGALHQHAARSAHAHRAPGLGPSHRRQPPRTTLQAASDRGAAILAPPTATRRRQPLAARRVSCGEPAGFKLRQVGFQPERGDRAMRVGLWEVKSTDWRLMFQNCLGQPATETLEPMTNIRTGR